MDLSTQLLQTKSGDTKVVVYVDRSRKMLVHFAPVPTAFSAYDMARMFVHVIVRAHGTVRDIVSDNLFTSEFWEEFTALLGAHLSRSTAYHPQSDGQTERVNRTLEEMMRHYVSPTQDDWDEHLNAAEFAINNAWHESVCNTPFFLNSGQHPLTPASVDVDTKVPAAKSFTYKRLWTWPRLPCVVHRSGKQSTPTRRGVRSIMRLVKKSCLAPKMLGRRTLVPRSFCQDGLVPSR